MNWLNTPTSIIHAPEYVGSEPTQRATWWNLMVFCAEQENGGVIVGGSVWKDRRWQQTCGVTAEEIHDDCDLWQRIGSDVVLWGYPKEKEFEVQAKRIGGQRGGYAKAAKQANSSSANGYANGSASTEGKGREGKGIGMEGEWNTAREDLPPAPTPILIPDFSDRHTTTTAKHLESLAKKVRAMQPGWNIAFTHPEMQALAGCSAALDGFSDTDWKMLGDYLRAKLPEGSAGWQPKGRSKFLETVTDVYSHATQWARKNPTTNNHPGGAWK